MNLDTIDPDRLEAVLFDHGAQSVSLLDAGDDPVLEPAPGETPLWQHTKICALFPADADFESLRRDIGAAFDRDPLPPNRVETLPDRVWEREWLSGFGPMRFGRRLWVVPLESEAPRQDAIVVRMDPGLAFGTGTHETTRLCLEWLDAIDLTGRTVFDFGCGSGILSVAAAMLGAAAVTAVDIDLQAIAATRQNAQRNGMSQRIEASTAMPEPRRQFGAVVANILASTLIANAALIAGLLEPGGRVALSGILAPQADDVKAAFGGAVDFEPAAACGDWICLSGTRNRD